MIEIVDSVEDLTVFPPSNDAFAAISSVAGELSDDQLATILRYHVIRGKVKFSPSLTRIPEMKVNTLSGEEITIRSINGSLFVNQARVVSPDIIVGDGVIHVIDRSENLSQIFAPLKNTES